MGKGVRRGARVNVREAVVVRAACVKLIARCIVV